MAELTAEQLEEVRRAEEADRKAGEDMIRAQEEARAGWRLADARTIAESRQRLSIPSAGEGEP